MKKILASVLAGLLVCGSTLGQDASKAAPDKVDQAISRAIDYLEYEPTQVESAYFVAYKQKALTALTDILRDLPDLMPPDEVGR